MEERDLSKLNKLINIVDANDSVDDMFILRGIAINADDLEAFLDDVVELAVKKYGGASYSELLDIDPDDAVMAAAAGQYEKEQIAAMFRAVEKIMRGTN